MKKKLVNTSSLYLASILSVLLVFAGCNSDDADDSGLTTDSLEVVDTDVSLSGAQKVFYALPSPFEVAAMLKSSGVAFDEGILNPVDNLSKYSTSRSMALNLGVYGADLSFASMFDQTQSSILYMSAVRKLCEELGISSAFTPETMERLEANQDNQDSVQQIVSDAYLEANAYLKENERDNTSALILAGGWVEGLYIATRLTNPDSPNEDLMLMVAEQKYSLENLVALLESYQGNDISDILEDLSGLVEIYSQVVESEDGVVEHHTNTEQKVTVIGGSDVLTISSEQLASISESIAVVREKYTQ